jgi:XapX domain-containing protein
MKAYLVSVGAGLLVGAIYGFLNVRSPAPPVIALLGLLGMLVGEQVAPIAKHLMAGQRITVPWVKAECGQHLFGRLPSASKTEPASSTPPRET